MREARQEEMKYITLKQVWEKCPRNKAIAMGYKIVDTRWIDTDKGDEDKPIYRSRLVGKEFNTGQEDGLFASTPPLEALRFLISEAATEAKGNLNARRAGATGASRRRGSAWETGGPNKRREVDKVMLISDVSRAFFEAPAKRKVAVVLPDEAFEPGEEREGIVGILRQSLYGARDAAINFQNEVKRLMMKLGFVQSKYNASLYYNPVTDVKAMIHGDDFVAVGDREEIKIFRQQIANRFTVKDKVVGLKTEDGEIAETRVLNRIVRVTPLGWEYEADQRHADLIISELGLSTTKSTKTPGEDEPAWKMEDGEMPLDRSLTTKYRALAARANYLALDTIRS